MTFDKLSPWIRDEDLLYFFGVRKSVFVYLKKHNIVRAIFSLKLSDEVNDNFKRHTSYMVNEILSNIIRYNIFPIFMFTLNAYEYIIPRNFKAICDLVENYYEIVKCRSNAFGELREFVENNKKHYLLGFRLERYDDIAFWQYFKFKNMSIDLNLYSNMDYGVCNAVTEIYDFIVVNDMCHSYTFRKEFKFLYEKCVKIRKPLIKDLYIFEPNCYNLTGSLEQNWFKKLDNMEFYSSNAKKYTYCDSYNFLENSISIFDISKIYELY